MADHIKFLSNGSWVDQECDATLIYHYVELHS